jgi:uncharacterized protein YndB with AHSA1/START domain
MTTKSSEQTSLTIKRVIKAPRDRVYAAWTDPAQLRQWFGPDNVRTRELVADIRIGGKYRWDIISPEEEQMAVSGEYLELVPGKKVVFTWQWEDDENWENRVSVVTVELSDRGENTELTLTHEKLPNEQSRDNHNEGWTKVINRLENFL